MAATATDHRLATSIPGASRSAGLARRLHQADLSLGDRLVAFMQNHPRYLEVLWGVWRTGLVVVPAMPDSAHYLGHSTFTMRMAR